MQETVVPEPGNTLRAVDNELVLVQDVDGPFYANRGATVDFRRIGQRIYYTQRLADRMYREILYHSGQAGPIIDRFVMDLASAGNTTYELVYKNSLTWEKIFEDLLYSPVTTRVEAELHHACKERREFEHISLDGTIRVIRRVVGQADYLDSKAKRESMPFPDAVAKRKVLTVVGRAVFKSMRGW